MTLKESLYETLQSWLVFFLFTGAYTFAAFYPQIVILNTQH